MPEVKNKGRILKVAREKQLVTYMGGLTMLLADISTEICWPEGIGKIFKVTKSKDLHPRLFYLARLSFRVKEEKKSKAEQ